MIIPRTTKTLIAAADAVEAARLRRLARNARPSCAMHEWRAIDRNTSICENCGQTLDMRRLVG